MYTDKSWTGCWADSTALKNACGPGRRGEPFAHFNCAAPILARQFVARSSESADAEHEILATLTLLCSPDIAPGQCQLQIRNARSKIALLTLKLWSPDSPERPVPEPASRSIRRVLN